MAPDTGPAAVAACQDAVERCRAELELVTKALLELHAQAAVADTDEARRDLGVDATELHKRVIAIAQHFDDAVAKYRWAVDPLNTELAAALGLDGLPEVEAALASLEARLDAEARAEAAGLAVQFLGLVRFHRANILCEQAYLIIRTNRDHRRADDLLKQARATYNSVLDAEDIAADAFGSSIHACALHQIILIESNFYKGYRELARQDGSRVHAIKRDRHRKAAETLYERLCRVHPDARLPDQRLVSDAAKGDVAQIGR